MHFRFSQKTPPSGGIRLIEEIPDYRICHLEGQNGAGKTLALRLLQLITGEQPYEVAPNAWASLREGLGEVSITIAGFAKSAALEVALTPSRWPSTPDPVGGWLGEATWDDEPMEIQSIPSLIRVIRIAGDESFEGTIHQRLAEEDARVRRVHSLFEDKRVSIEVRLDELMTASAVVDTYEQRKDDLRASKEKLGGFEAELQGTRSLLEIAERGRLAHQRLAAIKDELPGLEKQLTTVAATLESLESRLKEAKERQSVLTDEVAGEPQVEKELKKVKKRRDQRQKRLQRLSSDIQRLATQLDVDGEESSIDERLTHVKEEQEDISSQLASAGHHAAVRELASNLEGTLNDAPQLDSEVIAVIETDADGLRLTAGGLRVGVEQRRVELSEVDDDPLIRQLRQAEAELGRRTDSLKQLREELRKRNRAGELLEESERDLEALIDRAEAKGEAREEFKELAALVGELEREQRELLAEEARLRVKADELSSEKSPEELSEEVDLAIEDLGLPSDESLDAHHQALQLDKERLQGQMREARKKKSELERMLAIQQEGILQAANDIATLTWLPPEMRQALTVGEAERRGEVLKAVRETAENLRASLYRVRDFLDRIVDASRRLAEAVPGRREIPRANSVLPHLLAEIEARLTEELDEPEIRTALFDDGRLEAVDLENMEARWVTSDGEHRSRPFEAFSSGEQIFAYTRARIARAEALESKYKILALDEFGAFLARDRLERLVRYLQDAVIGSIVDQVIIVIPLAANYEEQAKSTKGDLGERFEKRAAEIRKRLYFAEDAGGRGVV